MPLPHPPEWANWALETAQPDPLIWLFDIRNPTGGPVVDRAGKPVIIRITPNRVPVVFGVDAIGNPLTWDPYPVTMGEVRIDSSGAVSSFNVSVSNAAAMVMAVAEANGYFEDHQVFVHLVDSRQLNDPTMKSTRITTVTEAGADWAFLTLTLGGFDLASFDSPKQVITDDSCGWRYRADGCFFIGDPGNAELGLCDHTLDTGCKPRGAWEIANGLPQLHPKQFKAFPGVPSGSLKLS